MAFLATEDAMEEELHCFLYSTHSNSSRGGHRLAGNFLYNKREFLAPLICFNLYPSPTLHKIISTLTISIPKRLLRPYLITFISKLSHIQAVPRRL